MPIISINESLISLAPDPKGAADQALNFSTAEFQIFYWMREVGFSNLVVATMRNDINTNLSDSDRWARNRAMCSAGLDAAFDAIWDMAGDDPGKPANAETTVEAWRDAFGLRSE